MSSYFFNRSAPVQQQAQQQEQGGLGESKLAVVQSMISQIRNGTPIYRVQLPIFLTEPRSLLDRYSDFCTHLDLLMRLPEVSHPELRFVECVRFYLSGWHLRAKDLRNPFNPILGEVFNCSYDHGDSVTHYSAEQISHHPPSTAFAVLNDTKGMYLNAYIKPAMHFKGNSMDVELQGKIMGHDMRHKEDFEITFPHIIIRNVIMGTLGMTLSGDAKISCPQSGYYAELEFKGTGMFHSKVNYVVCNIKHTSSKKSLYSIEGRWDEIMYITNCKTGRKDVFFDPATAGVSVRTLPPVTSRAENDSNRVWGEVMNQIHAKNEFAAMAEKTKVEEAQRVIAADRAARGLVWSPKNFIKVTDECYIHKQMIRVGTSSIADNARKCVALTESGTLIGVAAN
eukprot:TRINITY_DN115_c0_g1_i1.p1 TRINITY_DN115_c0_g1~~TRINITY_DN115_c0_g1_i1.p1  ORF type:complete len:396 (-),score=72.26 TRINITY_DN115_c0_g1_i1:33-1220(-)